MAVTFGSKITKTGTYPAELWIDLGVIPAGFRIWIGSVTYNSSYKVGTFELRTNTATKSTGTIANTVVLDTWTSSSKVKSITKDLYKNGTLHIATVAGTGVEHWWLRLFSKTTSAQAYSASISYTTE